MQRARLSPPEAGVRREAKRGRALEEGVPAGSMVSARIYYTGAPQPETQGEMMRADESLFCDPGNALTYLEALVLQHFLDSHFLQTNT